MSPSDNIEIPLESVKTVSPSPARDALRSNLSAADSEPTQTLKKRKSWMASLRDAVHRGAMQAKSAVDLFRGDQSKAEANIEPETTPGPAGGHSKSDCPRHSSETAASARSNTISSSTPNRPHHGCQNSFAGKFAPSSLRQHFRNNSTGHRKRGSVYSVTTRPSNESEREALGPEHFMTPPQQASDHLHHQKRDSLAGSLVGSLRSMGRKQAKTTTPTDLPSQQAADKVPLPSSPIDIPTAAPAIELDLGPSGFDISSPTPSGPSKDQHVPRATPTVAFPGESTLATKKTSPSGHITFSEVQNLCKPSIEQFKPVAPRDILRLSTDDVEPILPPAPTTPETPMPGTAFTLEVDGASSETDPVFERSVTPSTEKERKELRAMRSLDAMACTLANHNDDNVENTLVTNDGADIKIVLDFPKVPAPLAVRAPRSHRNAASAETVQTLPPDMSELTRQYAKQEITSSMDFSPYGAGDMALEDPFGDNNAVASGPPSPSRSVTLPFRPKAVDQKGDTAHADTSRIEAFLKDDMQSCPGSYVFKPSSPISPTSSLRPHLQLQRNFAVAEGLAQAQERPRQHISDDTDPFENPVLDNDTQTRAEELLAPDIVLPDYGNEDLPESGLSPDGGPLAPHQVASVTRTPKDEASGPCSVHSRTYLAGLGDAQYKFSVESWLHESSRAPAPDEEPTTPSRRRMDMSLDSVSTNDERKTPQISPTTTNPGRTPSMGNKLEFDLKRSERNMRYNALHEETAEEDHGDPPLWNSPAVQFTSHRTGGKAGLVVGQRRPSKFIFGGSEELDENDVQLANFDDAFNSARETSWQTPDEPLKSRVESEESVAASLKDAVHNYSQLEEQLEGSYNVFADPVDAAAEDPFLSPTAASYGTFRDPLDGLCCSGLPSPETQPKERTSSPSSLPRSVHKTSMMTSSSADSPSTITAPVPGNDRVASLDTLDESLAMFSSPDSGYQADNSSLGGKSSSGSKNIPARYRSGSKRRVGGPHKDIARNF